MRKMALICMFVIVASAAPIYAATPNATNTSVNTTNSTPLVNDTTTVTPICVNKTNTSWNNTKYTWNTTNTSVNTTNSTKHKEIQNLVAKIKINQAEIQGLNKEDKTLENQIPALLKQQNFVQVKDFIATSK
jgi:hypothetical protein